MDSTYDEGPRLCHFRMAVHKMLQATMKSCSGETAIEQCFPFGLTSTQNRHLSGALKEQIELLHEDINGPVEAMLQKRHVPEKLYEIDRFLRTSSLNSNKQPSNNPALSSAKERVYSAVLPAKLATRQRLQQQVETLRWQNEQRAKELTGRQRALQRRAEHVADAQQLYDVAWGSVMAGDEVGSQLELLVDRMVQNNYYQAVPLGPPINPEP